MASLSRTLTLNVVSGVPVGANFTSLPLSPNASSSSFIGEVKALIRVNDPGDCTGIQYTLYYISPTGDIDECPAAFFADMETRLQAQYLVQPRGKIGIMALGFCWGRTVEDGDENTITNTSQLVVTV